MRENLHEFFVNRIPEACKVTQQKEKKKKKVCQEIIDKPTIPTLVDDSPTESRDKCYKYVPPLDVERRVERSRVYGRYFPKLRKTSRYDERGKGMKFVSKIRSTIARI